MVCILLICRFVVVCGYGEYIIYTAMALRNKSFGSAQEFVNVFLSISLNICFGCSKEPSY